MPKSDTKSRPKQTRREKAKPQTETRIDAAHDVGPKEEQPVSAGEPPAPQAVESQDGETVTTQLRKQASELAAHLRAKQKEIDHREARINTRIAELEHDSRSARLWFGERQAELEGREKDIANLQREVHERLDRLAAAEAALQRRSEEDQSEAPSEAELTTRAEELAEQEVALNEARQALQAQREQLEARAAALDGRTAQAEAELHAQEEQFQHTAETLQAGQQRLKAAEAELADAQGKAQSLGEQLSGDRREAQEEIQRQRRRLAEEQRRQTADLERQRQAVQRRSDHVDHCRAALEQLRAELGRMHRETLEIRLATEELWVQLSGAAPPAALTRSLGRIRTKLADSYRQSNAELREQKRELESIRGQLAEQYDKLVAQKRQFEQWAAQRREETEEQAERLVAREEQLQLREAELTEQGHRWEGERLEYQEEIRRLKAQCFQGAEDAIAV